MRIFRRTLGYQRIPDIIGICVLSGGIKVLVLTKTKLAIFVVLHESMVETDVVIKAEGFQAVSFASAFE